MPKSTSRSLTDLAIEWNQPIMIVFNAKVSQWAACFVNAKYCCDLMPIALGDTPTKALKDLAQKIGGHRVVFADNPLLHITIPKEISV